MPKSCAARQCCNRYSNRRKQLTFHRFPFSRPELLKEWVLNIGRGDFEPKQHTVICSEHFRPECFSAFGNRKNLKHNAVPTVFAFQGPPQLVRENTDPTGRSGDATSGERKVLPETGSGECGLGRKMDTTVEVLQLPPEVGGLGAQVPPHTPETSGVPGQPASPPELKRRLPTQPSDHSYALLDLDTLKKKLFLTLKENEKLRRRLKAQRLVMRRMCSRLRARLAGRPGLQTLWLWTFWSHFDP
uniref:THAP domain containing 3 n=1 Tax=Bos taurus TaxID=9913 RepID=A0AAA9SLY2_BOVIN